jgi:hypothetical protein
MLVTAYVSMLDWAPNDSVFRDLAFRDLAAEYDCGKSSHEIRLPDA